MTTNPLSRLTGSLLFLFLTTQATPVQADRWATLSGLDDELVLSEGETALVLFVPGSQAKLSYQRPGGPEVTFDLDGTNRGSINGNRGQASGNSPLPLAGPATVMLRNTTVVGLCIVSTEIATPAPAAPQSDQVPSEQCRHGFLDACRARHLWRRLHQPLLPSARSHALTVA